MVYGIRLHVCTSWNINKKKVQKFELKYGHTQNLLMAKVPKVFTNILWSHVHTSLNTVTLNWCMPEFVYGKFIWEMILRLNFMRSKFNFFRRSNFWSWRQNSICSWGGICSLIFDSFDQKVKFLIMRSKFKKKELLGILISWSIC